MTVYACMFDFERVDMWSCGAGVYKVASASSLAGGGVEGRSDACAVRCNLVSKKRSHGSGNYFILLFHN